MSKNVVKEHSFAGLAHCDRDPLSYSNCCEAHLHENICRNLDRSAASLHSRF